MSEIEETSLFRQLLRRFLPLGDFHLELQVQILSRFSEFVLSQRTEEKGLVHRDGRFVSLRALGHLNHDAHEQFLRHQRPHRIGPEHGLVLRGVLFRVIQRFACAKDLFDQGDAFVPIRQQLGDGFSDEVVSRLRHELTKGRIHITHDVCRALHRGHRKRRLFEGEAREGVRLVCGCGFFGHRAGSGYFVAFGSGVGSSLLPTRVGIPVVRPV